MCVSRLHRVLELVSAGVVEVEDVQGGRRRVLLLALDGAPPATGEWLVVHSGYAIDRVDADEAEAIAAELQRGLSSVHAETLGTESIV